MTARRCFDVPYVPKISDLCAANGFKHEEENMMDVNGIAAVATSMAEFSANQAAGIAVLKKAIDSNAAGALALIEAIPDANQTAASLPQHLGQNVNTTA